MKCSKNEKDKKDCNDALNYVVMVRGVLCAICAGYVRDVVCDVVCDS